MKYQEPFSEETDLDGLAAANVAAAFSGTFIVNGSPAKTQMADSAGGRSQLAALTTAAVVLIVLLVLTGPLASLPIAALAAVVVFLIAAELVDVPGMRRILAVRRHEFTVALLTAAAVVVLGVQDGIELAVSASIIDTCATATTPQQRPGEVAGRALAARPGPARSADGGRTRGLPVRH